MQWPPPPGAGNLPSNVSYDRFRDLGPVGMFKPTPLGKFGVFDLAGNVWEWCADFYEGNAGDVVLRGNACGWIGTAGNPMESFATSFRHRADPNTTSKYIGFRCVIELVESQ